MSDPDHCGGCEEACSATEVCSQGHCSDDCASGEVECNRACVDTEVDPSNCGECGNVCEGGQICTAGSCSCTSDESLCGGACIDTSSDPSNCGSCDHACANGQSCVDGECTGGQTGGSGGTSGAGGSTQTGGTPPTPTPAACSEAFEEDAACSDSTGQTYYVSSSSGSDGNDGLSEEAPLATIGAVNELSLGPGDRVLFKCGDTWDLEQLNVTSSGAECQHIVYSSYPAPCPAGQEPTLSGRRAISGFAQDSGNVWVADLSAGDNAGRFPRGINQLFRDASRLPMGKWPNPGELANGFSYIDTHDGNVIEDDELPSEDWSGAVIRIRTVRWLLLNREVTSSSGSALTLGEYVDCYADDCGDPDPGDSSQHGFGYQITSHRATLDQPGEWYYDADENRVYLVSDGTPENVSGSAVPSWADEEEDSWDYDGAIRIGVDLEDHAHHVVIENLRVEGYFGSGIAYPINLEADEPYNLVIRCNAIQNVEARGVSLQTWVWDHPTLPEWYGGRNLVVKGNVVTGANYFGIQSYARSSVFEDNVVTDIGRLENLGRRGLGCGLTDDDCTENGDGIHLPVSDASINSYDLVFRHNQVARTAYCGFDIFGHDITVEQNLIEQACFTKADCGGIRTFGREGDSPCHDITLDHNIILSPVGNVDGGGMGYDTPMAFGLYIDNLSNAITSLTNTLIDAPSSGILYQNSNGTIEGNTLFDTATGGGEPINAPDATATDNTEFSTASEPNGEIFFNATSTAVNQTLAGSYQDVDGASVSGSISIAPYESVILIAQ